MRRVLPTLLVAAAPSACMPGAAPRQHNPGQRAKGRGGNHLPELEDLAYKAGTDKSKDDHKYVDVYASLFDPIRQHVRNVTEIGVASGQSISMWHKYFHHADVWGFDMLIHSRVSESLRQHKQIHLIQADAYTSTLAQLSLEPESMDIVIDDALHETKFNEIALATFFPLVKPCGYYVIEDVEWDRTTNQLRLLNPGSGRPLARTTIEILQQNAAFFVDSLLGHRNFTAWQQATTQRWTVDRERHNSHLAIIHKRKSGSRPWPFQMNFGATAMSLEHVGK